MPQSLRQTTEVQLTAEIYNQAEAAFGLGSNGLTENVVLDQTFNDVDLVGRPLTIGNFVSSGTPPGLFITATTNTYSPYVEIGDDAPESQPGRLIHGTDYQEVLTNFPLGSQILTGLFLNINLKGQGLQTQSYSRTILDRIGAAARAESQHSWFHGQPELIANY